MSDQRLPPARTYTWESTCDDGGDMDDADFDPCPMGCGRLTDDVAGGPCSKCWDEVG
jgi:hypothetical protein